MTYRLRFYVGGSDSLSQVLADSWLTEKWGGFTRFDGVGGYTDESGAHVEDTQVYEILMNDKTLDGIDEHSIVNTLAKLKAVFNQTTVLFTIEEVVMGKLETVEDGSLLLSRDSDGLTTKVRWDGERLEPVA